ncbi:universal stress protein [Rossellomorea vietnamensis]|uniref:Universal stress protein n=1 Tax=Rossellomorea vietnamensis TaxID=218284 RepID=A0A5D4NQK6_9BACI|nr:universal stress protein [Rossellomorea vietnamensis]TYS16603.1 universal stress protein [Rossellomorea vietnamensis]
MFNKILLAIDGSKHSIRSAEHAIEIAKKFNSSINVVYVIDGDTSKYDVLHNASKFEIERKRKEKIQPVTEMLENEGVKYELHFPHGEPGPTIIDFANDQQQDCVIIGSRGLNNLQTMILGSVSHKVAKHVKCPVLIVK